MASELQAGSVFAQRYRALRRIGAGGMGAVYEARHLNTGRLVALKVMQARAHEQAALRERFSREAHVTAGVHSEHVVEVLDAGFDDQSEMPYLVMELLTGEDLDRRLKQAGKFSLEQAFRYLHQTALALDAMHKKSIVHRDLKPANLFLAEPPGREPLIKVLDFGVAKILDDASTGSVTDVLGTYLYMAPEQFQGSKVSAATDIYALGLIAYTFLTGQAYWAPEWDQKETKISFGLTALHGPKEKASVRALERTRVSLPSGFDDWFERATARLPAERYPTALSALRALADVLGVPRPSESDPSPAEPVAEVLAVAGPAMETVGDTALRTPTGDPSPAAIVAPRPGREETAQASDLISDVLAPPDEPTRPFWRRRAAFIAVLAGLLAAGAGALIVVEVRSIRLKRDSDRITEETTSTTTDRVAPEPTYLPAPPTPPEKTADPVSNPESELQRDVEEIRRLAAKKHFKKALDLALKTRTVPPGEASPAMRAMRFEAAWMGYELRQILDNARGINGDDPWVDDHILAAGSPLPEPLSLDILVRVGAICASTKDPAARRRRFEGMESLIAKIKVEDERQDVTAWVTGAKRYIKDNLVEATTEWRKLNKKDTFAPIYLTAWPDAIAEVLQQDGDRGSSRRLIERAEKDAARFGGANMAMVLAARRLTRGDPLARDLAKRVIDAWSDEARSDPEVVVPPAVAEMRELRSPPSLLAPPPPAPTATSAVIHMPPWRDLDPPASSFDRDGGAPVPRP